MHGKVLTYQAHALPNDPYEALVVDGLRVREEEPGEGDVEEGDGGDDGSRGYERHGGLRCWGIHGEANLRFPKVVKKQGAFVCRSNRQRVGRCDQKPGSKLSEGMASLGGRMGFSMY